MKKVYQITEFFLVFFAIFFYTLCWFVETPTKSIHNLGIALPWLSLALSVPIGYVCKVKDGQYFAVWGYVYAAATIIYVIAVSLISGTLLPQLPHLAACVCFIAYFSLEAANKK